MRMEVERQMKERKLLVKSQKVREEDRREDGEVEVRRRGGRKIIVCGRKGD